MKKYLKIVCPVVLGLFVLGTTLNAADNPIEAKAISKEEAAKKYPAPKGGYPVRRKRCA